jgi:hypothetical protein
MKSLMLVVLLVAAGSLAQDAIPVGTILPIQLNSSLRSNKARPGQMISGRVMQDVPLTAHSRIPGGAKVMGHVVAVRPATDGKPAEMSVRFDTVVMRKQRIPVTTNLRAMATMMDIDEAQIPPTGPDHGTPSYIWPTHQIGGEVAYGGGGVVSHGSYIVGHSVPYGVMVHASARPGSPCRADVGGNNRPQALWLFSSDACGLYDFPNLILAHAGRSDPVGEITLVSQKGDVNVRAGSGMLLRVNGGIAAPAD